MFNCRKYAKLFFSSGSMGFKKRGDERSFLKKLINLYLFMKWMKNIKKHQRVVERKRRC